MTRIAIVVLLVVAFYASAGAGTSYQVWKADDTGQGSLRAAIEWANAGGPFNAVTFADWLRNTPIKPLTPLPAITAPDLTIDGDLGGDGTPDIVIDGSKLTGLQAGLEIQGPYCDLIGLCFLNCPTGLYVHNATGGFVRSCRFSIDLAGTTPRRNSYDIRLRSCTKVQIGGTSASERNLFLAQWAGVSIESASSNVVLGNWFGLAGDGATARGMPRSGVAVHNGVGNVIGGTVAGARNVFVGSETGLQQAVEFSGSNCHDNYVQGSFFGLTASGTAQRRLPRGVLVQSGVGRQIIGGNGAAGRNYFAPNAAGAGGVAVELNGGANSSVHNNWFGLRPDGHSAPGMSGAYAIRVSVPGVTLEHNLITHAGEGIRVTDSTANPGIFKNAFRNCAEAVHIVNGARCSLGNLSNTNSDDDGDNTFASSNSWFIFNDTANAIKAEGNSFGTTSRAAISAKIHDKRDNSSLGLVDFDPLKGGVHPTGEGPAVALAAMSAVPAAAGAEIAFSLTGPAAVTVEVLNLAGRPVAVVARERASEAGATRLVWSGITVRGTRAPAGSYLVRVTARSDEGGETRALCGLHVAR